MSSSLEKRDPLIGLLGLPALRALLRDSIGHSSQIALLFCDVDRLRYINAEFGHVRADEELCRIARGLERICAPSPVFRIGGDEFVIVLPDIFLEQARAVAAQMLAAHPPIAVSFQGQAPVETLSLSIGIALFPTHATTEDNLLEAADIALLKVKRGGRLPDGTRYTGRNRAMTWGDFLDEFPHESARFLNPDFVAPTAANLTTGD